MAARPTWLLIALALTGCRNLLGIEDVSVIDGSVVDATIDGGSVDGLNCFSGGPTTLCLAAATKALVISTATLVDTSTDNLCDQIVPQPAAPELCVIHAFTIDITAGSTLRAIGGRPLVLVADGTFTIDGTVDVASSSKAGPAMAPGAASGKGACMAGDGQSGLSGAGGGAGGSLGGKGGNGGNGGNGTLGGGAGLLSGPFLGGGCDGTSGGDGPGLGGAGGAGGGGVWLLSRASITVGSPGEITANGAGGHGAVDNRGGGGGGGSGGRIGLAAPVVTVTGRLLANSGGGGGGSNGGSPGESGEDGTSGVNRAKGGAGGGAGGGDGGDGTVGNAVTGLQGGTTGNGGGGGGGGAGVITIASPTTSTNGLISPPYTN